MNPFPDLIESNMRLLCPFMPPLPFCPLAPPSPACALGLGALTLLPAVLAAVTAGCLSPRLTQQLELPFYTVSQSLSVLDVMERLEPLVSAALLMGFFALESLLFASARAQLERVVPEIFRTPWGSWALGALAFGLHFVTGSIGENAWALGAAVCWGILPLLTQLIVAIK